MAHFAELNSDNIVIYIAVIDNHRIIDSDGNESESLGIAYCKKLFTKCNT